MAEDTKKIDAGKISREPTLSKLGADLRWLCEKSGIDPETVVVSINLKAGKDQALVLATVFREYDPKTMKRYDKHQNMVIMHGIPVWVISTGKELA